jgi:hypothetical protein
MVSSHLADEGIPFSLKGETRHLSAQAPPTVQHAAELLQAIYLVGHRVKLRDFQGALDAMFYVGFFCHEIGLSAGRTHPSYEAVASHAKSTEARRKAGAATRSFSDEQSDEVFKMVNDLMRGGLKKTPACTRVAALLAKKGIVVNGKTVARCFDKGNRKGQR